MGKEALVVCTDESVGIGITIWDMENGNQLLHIPTCSAAPHGLLCLRKQYLVAAQTRKHGSHLNGVIFFWPLNKPQSPVRSYTMEAIGPISCTRSGTYLAGGAPSGNAYVWEVVSGRLLKNWHAHNKLLKSLAFSNDDSLLVTAADDGVICVWSVISEPITALTFSALGLVSASKDLTACIWDISKWAIVRRFTHQKGPITNLVVIPQSTLLGDTSHMRVSDQFHASVLDKCPQPTSSSKDILAFLPSCASAASSGTNLLDQQIEDFEHKTPATLRMKLETSVERRLQAISMAKHVMDINKHLQSCLLDMMRKRFNNGSQKERKGRKLKTQEEK
ncbi:hypothetical protein Ancab_035621 [Ancistrocladus abbreviatus]